MKSLLSFKPLSSKIILVKLIAGPLAIASLLILGGCGQRGPLTLPERQFPMPPEKTSATSAIANPERS